ncbi:MAG: ATP-binding cassette domain-containing protein [Pseudomonadota bacterium]
MDDAPALVVDDLHKRFGDLEVLRGISLTARRGDVISILGSSGSGKSTFLRCINLLETPDRGTVQVGDRTIEMIDGPRGVPVPADQKLVEHLRTKLAMVFQGFNLWAHMTVMDNIIEAPVHVLGIAKPQAIERAQTLLEKVGMANRQDDYPAHLSGGQQQRVAIARALAMEPDVLLFDEPTSALDPELVGEVLQVMRDLAREGRTMLVVTHEMAFARDVSSHVVFLHQGQIDAQGPPDQLFSSPPTPRMEKFLAQTSL